MDEVLEFVLAVKAAQRAIHRRFNDALRPLGVTAVQAEALLVLAEAGPQSVKTLGDRIVAESGNPTRLVDRLVSAGYVERKNAEDDRRHVKVSLTRKGRRIAAAAQRVRQPLLEEASQAIAPRRLAVTTSVLRQICDLLP